MTCWHDLCNRKLFLDYHTQKSAVDVGKNFNARQWASSLSDAGVQAVSCIAHCGYGWRYYRKGEHGQVHPNLPVSMDILEETIRECHKLDIRVIAYVNTHGSEPICETNPEWRFRDIKGDGDSITNISICQLGPAMDEGILPMIGDIVRNYDVDGIFLDGTFYHSEVCYCESCKKLFKKDTGFDLSEIDDDKVREVYVEWVTEMYVKLRAKAHEVIKENKSNALLSVNWAYTTRNIEILPEGAGFLTRDVLPDNMVASLSFQARNWTLAGRPFDVMNHMSLKWWQEWSIKPVSSLNQEAMLVLANGGKTWVGYQMFPAFGLAPFTLKTLKANFDYIKQREKFFSDYTATPYVGVLHGESQIKTHPVFPLSNYADERSLSGLHRMFTLSGIPYNSVNTVDFMKYLNSFKVVVMANDQYVPEHVIDALDKYVYNGGKLILTGKSGMVDMDNSFVKNEVLEKMLGIEVDEGYPYSYGYIDLHDIKELKTNVADMPLVSSKSFTLAQAKSAKIMADLRTIYLRSDGQPLFTAFSSQAMSFSPPGEKTGTAAMTINNYGEGLAVYIATDIFAGYAGMNNWSLKNLTKNLINNVLLKDEALTINAPDYIELALSEREGEKLFHLINLVRESPLKEPHHVIEHTIGEEILPIYDIEITFTCETEPKRIISGINDDIIEFSYKNGRVSFTLPKLEIYECVVVKL